MLSWFTHRATPTQRLYMQEAYTACLWYGKDRRGGEGHIRFHWNSNVSCDCLVENQPGGLLPTIPWLYKM